MALFYRLIREKYRHQVLSIEGSRLFGGRWNPKGRGILYVTSTPELSLIEVLAHAPGIRYEDLPTYYISTLDVPDDIRYYKRDEMPTYWQDETYDRTQRWLADWLAKPQQVGVGVPSVLMPLSYNILLHPDHPLFGQIRLVHQEKLPIDRRLWRIGEK